MSHMDVASFPKVVSRLYTPLILQYLLNKSNLSKIVYIMI